MQRNVGLQGGAVALIEIGVVAGKQQHLALRRRYRCERIEVGRQRPCLLAAELHRLQLVRNALPHAARLRARAPRPGRERIGPRRPVAMDELPHQTRGGVSVRLQRAARPPSVRGERGRCAGALAEHDEAHERARAQQERHRGSSHRLLVGAAVHRRLSPRRALVRRKQRLDPIRQRLIERHLARDRLVVEARHRGTPRARRAGSTPARASSPRTAGARHLPCDRPARG